MMKTHSLSTRRSLSTVLRGLALVPCITVACANGVENVGTTGEPVLATNVDDSERYAPAQTSQFLGHWIGEADDPLGVDVASGATLPFRFASGSTQLELVLDFSQTDVNTHVALGVVRFGDADPPPPATEPDVSYPVGVDYMTMPRNLASMNLAPVEGFSYTVYSAPYMRAENPSVDEGVGELPDGVFRLSYSTYELFRGWCGLQDPDQRGDLPDAACMGTHVAALQTTGTHTSGRTCDIQLEGGITKSINCDQMQLCLEYRVCECNSLRCEEVGHSENPSELWLRPSAGGLVGVFVNAAFSNERSLPASPSTVRFRRAD